MAARYKSIGPLLVTLLACVGLAAVGGPGTVQAATAPAVTDAAEAKADAKPEADVEAEAKTEAVEAPGPFPLPAELPDPARFVVVPLHGEVGLGMAAVVDRAASDLSQGDILVLDINTFGGRVDAAVRIRDTLLELDQQGIPTVAYVHPRAISAGALIALATDIILVAPGATMGAATPVTIQGGEMKPVEEKTVSYMRKEMRATAEAQGRSGDIAEAMVDADLQVPGVSEQGDLLTLDGKQALAWAVASAQADTLEQAIAALGYGPEGRAFAVEHTGWTWAEHLAAFLSSATIASLLMSVGMLALMIGLYTGVSPLPLAIGGVCLGLFFFGHHVVNLAGIEELLLFALGVGLILFEALSPGLALPGIAGVLLVVLSLVLGLIDLDHVPLSVQWHEGWITRALTMVFGSIAATAALAYAAVRALPESRLGRHLLLDTVITGRATDEVESQPLVGQTGLAVTDLRPAGKIKIGARRLDAVTERGFVPAGARVKVQSIRGFSAVVRLAPDDAPGAPPDTPAGETAAGPDTPAASADAPSGGADTPLASANAASAAKEPS